MRLISRLLCVYSESSDTCKACEAEVVVDADNPFLVGTVLDRVALVEMLAQTFAAGSAMQKTGEPQVGYLVGLRDVRFYDDARLGDTLRIRVRLDTRLVPFFMLCGEVVKRSPDNSETLLAEGQIRLFLPERPESSESRSGLATEVDS